MLAWRAVCGVWRGYEGRRARSGGGQLWWCEAMGECVCVVCVVCVVAAAAAAGLGNLAQRGQPLKCQPWCACVRKRKCTVPPSPLWAMQLLVALFGPETADGFPLRPSCVCFK